MKPARCPCPQCAALAKIARLCRQRQGEPLIEPIQRVLDELNGVARTKKKHAKAKAEQ